MLRKAKDRFKMKENSNRMIWHLQLLREQELTGYIVCCPTDTATELSYLQISFCTCFILFFVEAVQNNQMVRKVTAENEI